jgi:hypothetical protein
MSKNFEFHHIGVPVLKEKLSANARYSPLFDMYSEEFSNNLGLKIELHAFGENSPLADSIKTAPHIAFKIKNIEEALKTQKNIVMPLYEPFSGYRCAMILLGGALIELIETELSEEKIWDDPETLKNGVLYGAKKGE